MRGFILAFAALALAVPAAAQNTRQGPQVAIDPPVASVDGTWAIQQGHFPGSRLTLARGPNNTISGSYVGLLSPNPSPCSGQYREASFLVVCQLSNNPVVYVGAARIIPTERRAGAAVTIGQRTRLEGRSYHGQLSAPNADLSGISFEARPA